MVRTLGVQKELHYLLRITILFLMLWPIHLGVPELKCGKPGHTPVCTYIENKDSYYEGEEVRYFCKETNKCYIQGETSRKCLRNGTWSEKIPVCYSELTDLRSIRVSSALSGSDMNLLVDRNKNTCVATNLSTVAVWEIELSKQSTVSHVRVDIPMNIAVLEAFVMEGNKTSLCGRAQNISVTGSALMLACPPRLNGNVAKIVQRAYPNPKQFKLCEVTLYSSYGSAGCLKPDTPLNGMGRKMIPEADKPSTYNFICQTGYELSGESEVQCLSDGSWTPTTALCNKKTGCGSLPSIANGVMVANSTSVNSTAWLECNEGYKPLSNYRIYCLPTGSWSSLSLTCEPIECDTNPFIPHGRGVLIDRSALYGFRLQIQCDPGYKAITSDLRQCQQDASWGNLNICVEINCGQLNTQLEISETGKWVPLNDSSSTLLVLICEAGYYIEGTPPVTQCLPNESWSYTTAVCRRISIASAWESDWTPGTMIMTAIAVGVGTTVCLLCLAMCILILKKRRQLNTNATTFHLGKTDSAPYNKVYNNFPYHTNNTAYEEVIELRHSSNLNSLPKQSELPNLPPDADPVYAQPFETTLKPLKKTSASSAGPKDDLYAAHIYAEPIDSRNSTSSPNNTANCASETWLRTGAKKFGRKVSLPDRSKTSNDTSNQSIDRSNSEMKRSEFPDLKISVPYNAEKCQTGDFRRSSNILLPELLGNNIYAEVKEDNLSSESNIQHVHMIDYETDALPTALPRLHMIDNDIYQGDYFSNV